MENMVHVFKHPCICTEGGIIKEGGYYFYKQKGDVRKYFVKIEKVIKNDRWAVLQLYFPQLGKRLEINHLEVPSTRECSWQIFDGYTDEDPDIPELDID